MIKENKDLNNRGIQSQEKKTARDERSPEIGRNINMHRVGKTGLRQDRCQNKIYKDSVIETKNKKRRITNMGTYEVGDHVIVREWDDMEREFGLDAYGDIAVDCSFVKDMSNLCGKEAVIIKIKGEVLYLDFIDINVERQWNFSEGMLRYKDAVMNISEVIDFESLWY